MSSDLGGDAGGTIGRNDLVRFFQDRRKPRSRHRIGLEVEHLPVDPATGRAHPFLGEHGVGAALRDLTAAGYEVAGTADPPTQLRNGPLAINVEPGGQPEVSSPPLATLLEGRDALAAARAPLLAAAQRHGFALLSMGLHPVSRAEEVPEVPKRRYGFMVRHFRTHGGPRFLDMMRLTASVQVNLDYEDEADAFAKLRLGTLLGPVATALFAASPLAGGRPSGSLSERARVWTGVDAARQGPLRTALFGPFTFAALVEELLAVPSLVLWGEGGGLVDAHSRPFRETLAAGVSGRPAYLADWELHLSGIFTDARLKGYVEIRSPDAPPPGAEMTVPAFFTGLLTDPEALRRASALVADHAGSYASLKETAAREGLRGMATGGRRFLDLARELVPLAEAALRRRGFGEEALLAPLAPLLEGGVTFAERALERFEREGIPGVVAWARLHG